MLAVAAVGTIMLLFSWVSDYAGQKQAPDSIMLRKPKTYSFPIPANEAKTAENESMAVVQNSEHAETDSIGSEIGQPAGPTDVGKDSPELLDEPSADSPPAPVDMPLDDQDNASVFPTEIKDSSMDEKQVENGKPEEDFPERSVAEETATRTAETGKQAFDRLDNPSQPGTEESNESNRLTRDATFPQKGKATDPSTDSTLHPEKIAPTPSVLKSINLQTVGNKIVFVIDTSGPAGNYNSFTLQSPSRIVVDLMGNWRNEGKREYDINSNPVKKIRTGLYPEKLRIVIDVASDELPHYSVDKYPRGLILVVNIDV